MQEKRNTLPENILTPQGDDIVVHLERDSGGKITGLKPDETSIVRAAHWIDRHDRQALPYSSMGNIVICDDRDRPVKRIMVGLMNDYIAYKNQRKLDGIADFLGGPSKKDYIEMIQTKIQSPDVLAAVQVGMSEKVISLSEIEHNTEMAKEKAWTEQELMKLVIEQEKILDGNFGDADTFHKDFALLESLIAKSAQEMKLDGKEKNDINADGEDFLRGLLLWKHTIDQGYVVSVENSQPVLHDTTPTPSPERIAQTEKLQKALQEYDYKANEGSSLIKRRDNGSQIINYLTAASYHLGGQKDMIHRLEETEKKAGIEGSHFSTEDLLKKTELTPEEKTLVMLWSGKSLDPLIELQENQKKYVTESRENIGKSSRGEILQNFRDAPLGTAVKMFAAPAICAALLYYGINNVFGKGKKWYTRILGVPMMMMGMAAVPMLDKYIKMTGATSLFTDRPERKDDQADGVIGRVSDGAKDIWFRSTEMFNSFRGRYSGPGEWTRLMINEEIGPKMSTMPTGTLLWALADEGEEKVKYNTYAQDPLKKDAQDFVAKLTTEEKNQMKTLLTKGWERHKTLSTTITDNIPNAKKLTLAGDLLPVLEREDSWADRFLLSWDIIPNGWEQSDKKTQVLKIIAKKPIEWGALTMEELENWKDGTPNPKIDGLLNNDDEKKIIKEWWKTQYITRNEWWRGKYTVGDVTLNDTNRNMTLKKYLTS